MSFIGSYLPFAKTKAEREHAGDPRLSIPERYVGREQYLGLFSEAAMQAVRDRFLVPEDLASVMERGAEEWEQATK